jgi:hypothetical protein
MASERSARASSIPARRAMLSSMDVHRRRAADVRLSAAADVPALGRSAATGIEPSCPNNDGRSWGHSGHPNLVISDLAMLGLAGGKEVIIGCGPPVMVGFSRNESFTMR